MNEIGYVDVSVYYFSSLEPFFLLCSLFPFSSSRVSQKVCLDPSPLISPSPKPRPGAMEQLLSTGKVRYIDLNFSPAQIGDLIAHSHVRPAVYQMELHP